jgi:hypothetical protein
MNRKLMLVQAAIAAAQNLPERRPPIPSWPIEGQYTAEEQMEEDLTPWDDAWTDIGGEG